MKSLGQELEAYLVAVGMKPEDAKAAVYRYSQTWNWSVSFTLDSQASSRGVHTHVQLLLDHLKSEGVELNDPVQVVADSKPRGQFE